MMNSYGLWYCVIYSVALSCNRYITFAIRLSEKLGEIHVLSNAAFVQIYAN